MAMTKPIVSSVNAFDGNKDHIFSFTSVGGNQVIKNEIKIVNNQTNTIVYNNTIESYQFSQTVPKNTLTNGTQYAISFRTYGVENEVSDWATYVPFYCYTTPTITMNIAEGGKIETATYNLEIRYIQTEGELLDYAFVELYDGDSNNLISRGKNLYNSSEPPLILNYALEGLINDKNYKVKVTVVTVEQTVVESNMISFFVIYKKPQLYSTLRLTPNNCDGYIKINTNYVDIVGKTHPTNPYYINKEKIDCCGCDQNIMHENTSYNVAWNQGFRVDENMLLRLWFSPSCINGSILYLYSTESDEYLNIEYVRGTTKDYLHITTNSGTNINKEVYNHNNGTIDCFLWIKVESNVWEVILETDNHKETIFEWENSNNNVGWNMTTDEMWQDDLTYENYKPTKEKKYPLSSGFDKIIIGNGIFDHINITNNTDHEYSTEYPIWEFDTVIDCGFEETVNGGNITVLLRQISGIRLKRRDTNRLVWTTIYEKEVNSVKDLNINIMDTLCPSNVEQTYAFVPILDGNVEGDYIVNTVTPQWNGTFITDGTNIFKLYNSVVYDNTSQNTPFGVLTPIGSKYPTIIQNSEVNYKSGAISCQICGYKFEETRRIDRMDVTKQTNDFLQFLRNGKAKCLIDWNGNDIIFKVINSPSVSYNSYYGNGITNVAFSWAEQGAYDDQESLESLGLI